MLKPTPSTMPATSSRWALTNTPTTSTRRRRPAKMRAASAGSHARGEPGQRMHPTAQAPRSAAIVASSSDVTPQTLMRGTRDMPLASYEGLWGVGRDRLHEGAVADRQVQPLEGLVDRQRAHAQEAAVHAPGLLELRDDLLGGVDRDREADPEVAAAAAAAGLDLRVDADHAARAVDQRASRVAGIDRSVGLQDVVDLEVVGRP